MDVSAIEGDGWTFTRRIEGVYVERDAAVIRRVAKISGTLSLGDRVIEFSSAELVHFLDLVVGSPSFPNLTLAEMRELARRR